MRSSRFRLAAVLGVLAVVTTVAACGSDSKDDAKGSSSSNSTATSRTVTVASANFSENEILADIYGLALEKAGVTVAYKLKLGGREILAPALEKGELDLVPEYVGNLLAFYNANASKPGDDLAATTEKLRTEAKAKKLTVLEPSPAADGDIIAMTKEKATAVGATKISDLKGKESGLVMGGPPECAQRITCLKGLQDVYGLRFKEFKPLDVGGPITVKALKDGSVHVARLFSADPALKANGFVVLDDDKFIQPAGNVVPVIRDEALTDDIRDALDKVSKALTTDDLIDLNKRVDIDKEDAKTVAKDWVSKHLS
jgi:osmoprotectant transport system substrate-binding protein